MINRATDIMSKFLIDELLRLARIDRDWCEWQSLEPDNHHGKYRAKPKHKTWLSELWISGADAFANWAQSTWLIDGPKIFRPTVEQCAALEQIAVNLELHEYAQPYPALLVDLPEGRYQQFTSVLVHRSPHLLTCLTMSKDNKHDITTTVAVDGRPIEVSLQTFDADAFADTMVENGIEYDKITGSARVLKEDKRLANVVGGDAPMRTIVSNVLENGKGKLKKGEGGAASIDVSINLIGKQEASVCGRALRVAVNSCLALANFGHHAEYLFPKELERDQRQMDREAREHRKERPARDRVKIAPRLVTFLRDVKLHHTEESHEAGEPQGGEKSTHWRRGHWHAVLHGVGKSQRKLKLYPPVLVRADRISEQERISTIYHT
jgi:hypothetical protein